MDLDASVGDLSGDATGSGIDLPICTAGNTDSNTITVGIDTSSPGEKSGTVTINLASESATPTVPYSTVLNFQTTDQGVFGGFGATFPSANTVLQQGALGSSLTNPGALQLLGLTHYRWL